MDPNVKRPVIAACENGDYRGYYGLDHGTEPEALLNDNRCPYCGGKLQEIETYPGNPQSTNLNG